MGIILEMVISLVAILGAAVLFTNAIEFLGERMNLGQGAVGSVLAAVGTALPETSIPIIALVGAAIRGDDSSEAAAEIGVGAILGAPFLLATLAMFVVGAATFGFRNRRENGTEVAMDKGTARRDMSYFLILYALATGAGVFGGLLGLPFSLKIALAVLLVLAYVYYVYRTIVSGEGGAGEPPDDLTLWPESRFGQAPTWAVVLQVLGSLVVMGVGAHFFVESVQSGSGALGIPAGLISLVLAPLATELPEKFNSVIWLREDKDTLALGNITGAMVFQSSVPVSLGLLFTPWALDGLNALSAGLALLSGAVFLGLMFTKRPIRAVPMMGAGILYLVFLGAAIYTLAF